jgi:hypothetical protein
MTTAPAPAVGMFHRTRVRLFGERDAVADQLRDIARQGSSMAHLAHACAFALIVLFSAGSLVALGGDALASILAGWQVGRVDVPAAISVAVSTLLVCCMDVGMVYAASMLRLLASRRADASERRVHVAVMVVVAVLEAATYAYMSARYEHPAGVIVWALILARAGAAPLLSVYLSMARSLPVTARDILYQAELAAGQGVIRDVVMVAADAGAPLADKMSLYGAAAVMSASDRMRLDGMIAAVEQRATTGQGGTNTLPDRASGTDGQRSALQGHSGGSERPYPTGPGSPMGSNPAAVASERPHRAASIRLMDPSSQPSQRRRRGSTRTASAEAKARRAWHPGMTVRELERAARFSRSSASKWHHILAVEDASEREAGQIAQ